MNPNYNGGKSPTFDANLLAGGNTLAIGATGTIDLVVDVTPGANPGPYLNQARAFATGPAGSPTFDFSDWGIDPDPLPSPSGDNDPTSPGENDPTPVLFAKPAIGAAKQMQGTVNNGNGTYDVTYLITVKNVGDIVLNNVQVVDDLKLTFPAPATFAVLSKAGSGLNANGSYDGNTILNLLAGSDSLNPGAQGTVTLVVRVTPDGNLTGPYLNQGTATAQAPGGIPVSDPSDWGTVPDPNNNGNAGETGENDQTPVTFTEAPRIGVAKRVVSKTNNGDGTHTVVYEILVKNYGDVDLRMVQVTDDLAGTPGTFGNVPYTVQSVTASAGLTANWGAPDPPVDFNGNTSLNLLVGSDTLVKGGQGTITVTVRVTPGSNLGPYDNTATASGRSPAGTLVDDDSQDGTDPDPGPNPDGNPTNNNVPTPVTFIEAPRIGAAKEVAYVTPNGNGTYDVGYTITVKNMGDIILASVQVTDDLAITFFGAASFTPLSWNSTQFTENPTYDGVTDLNLLTGVDNLAVGATGTILLVVRLDPGTFAGPYNNSAYVYGTSPAGRQVWDWSDPGINPDPNGNGQPNEPGENDPTPVEFPLARISNLVWWDLDGDGLQDAGEPGIPGVTLFLDLNNDGTKEAGEPSATTGACPALATCGIYSFPNLLSGTHRVQIDPAEFLSGGTLYNWAASPPDVGGDDTTDSDGSGTPPHRAVVTLTPGQVTETIDFGFLIDARYTVTKTLTTAEPARLNSEVVFTIRVTNNGKFPIAVLPLHDTYKTMYLSYGYGVPIVYAVPSSTDTDNDGELDWSDVTGAGDLAPNAHIDVVVHFKAIKDTTGLSGGATQNTATVHDATVDPDGTGPLGTLTLPTSSANDTVKVETPTGVGVSGFGGVRQGGKVTLTWRTAQESKLAGFNIRRQAGAGEPVLLNSELLYAQNAGANLGAAYSFVDPAAPAGVLTYLLEAVRLDGSVEAVGGIEVKR